MRIAMLSWESRHSVAVGGVAVHVSELASALARRGHDVHVFTRIAHGQAYHERIDLVHYHRCSYPAHDDFVDDVNNMCRAFVDRLFAVEDMIGRFDIVHAHDWLAANAMIWIKQGRGHKCVLTIHSTEYARCGNAFPPGRSERIRYQERAGAHWADRVICVSHATKGEIGWMYEAPEDKTVVIYNGVNSGRFDARVDIGAVRQRYGIGPEDPTILFCGRLEWQKGPDLLLEAIPWVLQYHPDAKFIYVGEGGMRPDLERRSVQNGSAGAVRFAGFRDSVDLVALYKLSDGVCVPSRNEPFGIVILEAWSAGKPVVATDRGGPREIVQHERNGFLIASTPESIAWGVGTLFADLERARWMGANGKRDIDRRFAWGVIVEQTLHVYEALVPRVVSADAVPRPLVADAVPVLVPEGDAVVARGALKAPKESEVPEEPIELENVEREVHVLR